MQRITVINAKGGCGKTTTATNLASAFASTGKNTCLIDYDPQGSSMFWLNRRPDTQPHINGIAAYPSNQTVTRSWQLRMDPKTEIVIVDTPPGLKGLDLINQLKGTHTILIPVLPSSIDTHATANFIRDLYLIAKVQTTQTRLAIVCNRVKAKTLAIESLEKFLAAMNIPVLARLRETQDYNHASEEGLGILETDHRLDKRDEQHWNAILDFLNTPSL